MDRSSDPKLTRAEFFRLTAGVGAALLTSGAEAAGPQLKRVIPRSGEKIPAVGLGTARTFDVGRDPAIRAPRREVLRLFFREGGTVIDSSPMYGRAEVVTGDLLADIVCGLSTSKHNRAPLLSGTPEFTQLCLHDAHCVPRIKDSIPFTRNQINMKCRGKPRSSNRPWFAMHPVAAARQHP